MLQSTSDDLDTVEQNVEHNIQEAKEDGSTGVDNKLGQLNQAVDTTPE